MTYPCQLDGLDIPRPARKTLLRFVVGCTGQFALQNMNMQLMLQQQMWHASSASCDEKTVPSAHGWGRRCKAVSYLPNLQMCCGAGTRRWCCRGCWSRSSAVATTSRSST
jgi:hypothetical protein